MVPIIVITLLHYCKQLPFVHRSVHRLICRVKLHISMLACFYALIDLLCIHQEAPSTSVAFIACGANQGSTAHSLKLLPGAVVQSSKFGVSSVTQSWQQPFSVGLSFFHPSVVCICMFPRYRQIHLSKKGLWSFMSWTSSCIKPCSWKRRIENQFMDAVLFNIFVKRKGIQLEHVLPREFWIV